MARQSGLDRLLSDLTRRVESVRHAVVLSTDGLVTARSEGIGRRDAEHLAAVASGLHSLARGTGAHFGAGQPQQTMIEFEDGVLFVTSAGTGSCLCVLAGPEADVGQTAHEMSLLVNRVGEHLGISARHQP